MAFVTKESLITYFKTLDVATLEKLKKYSELLIIPDEDLLTNANMQQMVDKAHVLADAMFPEWTDRSKSDFGEFLVELFALFSEKDFWYINAFANEGILRKTHSYSNAYAQAATLGYNATTCVGAKANFNVTFAKGDSAITYNRGELVVSVDGIKFSNDEPFVIEASAAELSKVLTLSQGEQFSEDVTYNGHSVFLSKPNVDVSSIEVYVDNVKFTRVNNFGFADGDSPYFIVLPEEDGSCSIYFGSDGFGLSPALGQTIVVNYRTCKGSDANIPAGDVLISESLSDRTALYVGMVSSSSGGSYAESLTSIKENAPKMFANKGAAINETMAEELLNTYQYVSKSKVVVDGRDVHYSVIPSSGTAELTDEEKASLGADFEKRLMIGYYGVYTANKYVDFISYSSLDATKLILDAVILKGYSATSVEASLREFMHDITTPLASANYGGSFSKTTSEIMMRSRISGLQGVTFKILDSRGLEVPLNDFSLQSDEIFSTINQDNIIVRVNAV